MPTIKERLTKLQPADSGYAALGREAAAEIARLEAENERMRNLLECEADCPCCQESEQCLPDCTFRTDSPYDWQRMSEVRAALVRG